MKRLYHSDRRSSRVYVSFSALTRSSLTLVALVAISTLVWIVSASSSAREDDDGTCESSSSSSSTSSLTPRGHPLDETLWLYSFDSISSTQDQAKRIAESSEWKVSSNAKDGGDHHSVAPKSFVVTTREQSKGRGTHGRTWMGQRGNVFVTIGIRQEDWIKSKIPLTLLPLKIGSLVARHVQGVLNECYDDTTTRQDSPPLVATVKWPNDVLVNGRKISGVLIESSSNGWFLIGIGINLAYAPEVATSGPDRGRPATSIGDLCPDLPSLGGHEARQFAVDLAYDLHSFVHPTTTTTTTTGGIVRSGNDVLNEWKQWLDWDMEWTMRDTPERERVKIVDVLPDGRVKIQNVLDGRIRTLVSDYFL